MLTEEEIKEAEKIGQKSEVVNKLLSFWIAAQIDGRKAMRIAMNEKLLEISKTFANVKAGDNEDKTIDRIDKIVSALNKLPQDEDEKKIEQKPDVISDKHKDKALI